MTTDLSKEELEAMLAKKEAEEKAENEAKNTAALSCLKNDLDNAETALAEAKNVRKNMIDAAKKVAAEEGDILVVKAKESIVAIKASIREAGGDVEEARKNGTGFGGRKRDEVVLAVLSQIEGPAKGKDVASAILADGLYDGSPAGLTSAVCTSLNKMTVGGEVKKDGTTYAIA